MNNVFFHMYSSYLQIQTAYFKAWIRVFYILLQSALHRISFLGTDSDISQAKSHQFCVDSQNVFICISILYTVKRKRKMEDQIWLNLLFSNHQPNQKMLMQQRGPDQCVNVISLCVWERQKEKQQKKGLCADPTTTIDADRGKRSMQNSSESLPPRTRKGASQRSTATAFLVSHFLILMQMVGDSCS